MKGLISLLVAVSFTLTATGTAHAEPGSTFVSSLLNRWSDEELREERVRRVEMKAEYERSARRNDAWGTIGILGGTAATVTGAIVTAGAVTSVFGLPLATFGLLTLAESKSAFSRAETARQNAQIVAGVIDEIDAILAMRSTGGAHGTAVSRSASTRVGAPVSARFVPGGAAGAGVAR